MVGKLKTIVWDAPDIQALADFYVGAVGLTQHYADDEWVTLYSPDGWRFGVQRAPDHVPPQWPDPAHPQQMHVDFQVADIEAAAAHAESLGARRLSGNDHWITLADPAGHPFDLCQADVEGTKVFAVTIDTDDAPALGRFYSGLLGLDVTYEGPEGVLIGQEGEQVMFQQVAEHPPAAVARPGVPAAAAPRRHRRHRRRRGRAGRARPRRDPAAGRRGELAGVRRPARPPVLPAHRRVLSLSLDRVGDAFDGADCSGHRRGAGDGRAAPCGSPPKVPVWSSDLDPDLAQSVADDCRVDWAVALGDGRDDRVSVDDALTRVAESTGGLDIVVNVAGGDLPHGVFEETGDEVWSAVLDST